MDLTRQIDGYCERIGPEFWAEPLNALTNLAFILAGIAALAMARERGRLDGAVLWLGHLMLVIGAGSFLFHTFATVWAAMLDTGPILLFILSYFAIAMRYLVRLGWGGAVLATLGFLGVMVALSAGFRVTLGPLIGGTTSYLPALLGLVAVSGWLWRRGWPGDDVAAAGLAGAAAVFAVSLTFRVLDQPLCDAWPRGTHFLWHLLNATVLYLLVRTLIRHAEEVAARPLHR